MRRGIALFAGAALTCSVAVALAGEPNAKDSAPWHLDTIARLDHARLDAKGFAPDAKPGKYLHLLLKFNPAVGDRKLHKFRVVNRQGDVVGELHGFHPKKSLLVFEGEQPWNSLVGLFLEGLGHREPLFRVRPAEQTVDKPTTIHVPKGPPRTTYVRPIEVQVPKTTAVVPDTSHVFSPPATTRVVEGGADVVQVPGTAPAITEEIRIIHEPATVDVIREGGTRVVHTPGRTRVIREGGTRVAGGGGAHAGSGVGGGGAGGPGGGGGGAGGPGGGGGGVGAAAGAGQGAGAGTGPGSGADEATEEDEKGLGPWDLDPLALAIAQTLPAVGSGSGAGSGGGAGPGSGLGGGAGSSADAGAGSASGAGAGGGSGSQSAAGGGPGGGQGAGIGSASGSATGTGPGSGLGQGAGTGSGDGAGAGEGQGAGPGQGAGSGMGQGQGAGPGQPQGVGLGQPSSSAPADGSGAGPGQGQDAGPGQGPASGAGQGQGAGQGDGSGLGRGEGSGQAPGEGIGPGEGEGPGPGEGEGPGPEESAPPGPEESPGPAADCPPDEMIPPEDRGPLPGMGPGPGQQGPVPGMGPMPYPERPLPGMEPIPTQEGPLPGMGPGGGGGGGDGAGPGRRVIGPNYKNVAPLFGPRYTNLAPHLYDAPDFRGPEMFYYDPEIPYFDPRLPVFRRGGPGFGDGYGYGGRGGYGFGGGYGDYPRKKMAPLKKSAVPPYVPKMVLYISCGEESGPGQVFQVTEDGAVLGIVNLPYAATGLALHRQHGLVAAIPRDGGRLMRIDDTGKVSTILEKDETLVHPVDAALAADSDTVVVADNMSDCLAALTVAGSRPEIYQRFEGQKWHAQQMSVAVTTDKHVIFGTSGDAGIYRYAGDDFTASRGPLLPGRGGVAADTASLKWAATQNPDEIYVFEGEHLMDKFKLPPNKSHYRNGILSFAPTGAVVAAMRDSDKADDDPWLIQYHTKETKYEAKVRDLFQWDRGRMLDFVVGPRMYWERHEPSIYKSVY